MAADETATGPAPGATKTAEQASPPPGHSGPAGLPAHDHPSELEYIKVAVVLAVVTLAEVGVYYVPWLRPFLVPILLILAVVKFALVVLWFMHLRFDSPLFRRLFVTGIVLAVGVYLVVLATFHVWSR